MKRGKKGLLVRKRMLLWIIPVVMILVFSMAFLIYVLQYYRADEEAHVALEPDETVSVKETDYGWLFDGPSEDDALIFYPGGKVEETAYAPLLKDLARQGMDVCLVRMPFHLAVFGANKANDVMAQHDYPRWYIGGHSLGGAMAANYAAEHGEQISGVYMLASYATKPLNENTRATVIYGSEDGVLNMTKLEEGNQYLPNGSKTYVIEGGNHAQFGNYGIQAGDGDALISAEEQQRRTVELILQNK